MKQQTFILFDASIRDNLFECVNELPLDGKVQVLVRQTGSKSARQRGYQHGVVYPSIVKSGFGGEHEADEVVLDLACKFRWALPIMIRDDDYFAEAYLLYSEKYRADPLRMRWWVKENVHTEQLTVPQMAEYLTAIIHYYTQHGVTIPEPDVLHD